MRKIIKNSIKCKLCGDVIESKHRHDFVECKCGACAVDGGHDYLRRHFSKADCYTDLSVTETVTEDDKNNIPKTLFPQAEFSAQQPYHQAFHK